jgi:branched-chain amino acid transport system ATP-binding protein
MNDSRWDLDCENVCVHFGGQVALDEVSFSVAPESILGIVGPNGAGKTTLLNSISGLIKPSSGKIRILDRDTSKMRAHDIARLGVGRAFQLADQCGQLTVLDYMLLGLHTSFKSSLIGSSIVSKRCRAEESHGASRVLAALARSNLGHLDPNTELRNLPYGVRKRIDVLRTWLGEPKLVLLDEPTSGLSDSEVPSMVTEIKQLIADLGSTTLVVDHRLGFVREVCTLVVVLDFGRLLAFGETEEVLSQSAVRRAYLGS